MTSGGAYICPRCFKVSTMLELRASLLLLRNLLERGAGLCHRLCSSRPLSCSLAKHLCCMLLLCALSPPVGLLTP